MMYKVCLVIPMYNEEQVVGEVIKEAINSGYTVVCIDDASRDDSAKIAEIEGAKVIRHLINLGQGAAIQTGFTYLLKHSSEYEYIFTYDADGQHSIEDVKSAISLFEADARLEVVLGTRFNQFDFKGGFSKNLILNLMSKLARITIGIKVTDRHNGFRGFRLRALNSMKIQNPGFGHADEILRKVVRNKLNYCEISTNVKYTEYSKSKGQSLSNGFKLIFDRFLGAK